MLLIHARYLFVLLIASLDEGKSLFAAEENPKKTKNEERENLYASRKDSSSSKAASQKVFLPVLYIL